ncbi:hypothetical protein PISMIDRAFT_62225, partial [Pisolithus microcarpus 441]
LNMEPASSKADSATKVAENIQHVLDRTKHALAKAAEEMVTQAESSHSEAPLYNKWVGPYKITAVKSNAVELHLNKTLHIHPMVNVSQVKPYQGPLEGQKVTRPRPVVGVEDHDEEFEVEY